jgi:thiol-disulfide isomerase/thioredoxin
VRLPRTSYVAFAVTLIATTVALAAPPGQSRPSTRAPAGSTSHLGASVGVSAPELSVSKLSGDDPADLGQLAGRVVVLEFWATWCNACRGLMGFLDALHRDRHDDGLTVLAVSGEPEERIRAHMSREPVGFTIARDLGPTSSRYRVQSFPTVVLIARDGKVRHLMVGASGQSVVDLVRKIQEELDAPAP